MFPLSALKCWCVRAFLEITNICATTYVQQYFCAQSIYAGAQSLMCARAQLTGNTVSGHDKVKTKREYCTHLSLRGGGR